MSLPPNLDRLLDATQSAVQRHPEHRLEPARRRAIYEAFGPKTDPVANRARGWLAVLTAQRVLPIFEQALPGEELPRQLIEMAVGVLQGKFDVSLAVRAAADGHEVAGRLWGYDEAAVPWNSNLAGNAAHRALAEVAGQAPLAVDAAPINAAYDQDKQGIPPNLWSDEKLAQVAGDAASSAAVAFACSADSPSCDPDKLLEFWEWWLTEAIPTAFKMASQTETTGPD